MDGSPSIDNAPVRGCSRNGGGGDGGGKDEQASGMGLARLLARDGPHPVATAYRMDRFARGAVIDEKGMGAQPNLH